MYKKYAELLRKTNKTTYQVCKDTGIRESVISEWKKRGSNGGISTNTLKKLCDYFDVSADYFLFDVSADYFLEKKE